VKDKASSPRAKSEARVVSMRRAAWDGGRLGLCDARRHHGINVVALRGQDGSGGARHPTYIALEWLQVRKEEIGRRIWSVATLESADPTAWGGR
jgi:hypothetical protein